MRATSLGDGCLIGIDKILFADLEFQVRLRNILDVPGEPEEQENITVVIVSKGDKLAGLVVDSLIGQMEIVIKSLGKHISINKMISGATILGDGSVALIIDANTLV